MGHYLGVKIQKCLKNSILYPFWGAWGARGPPAKWQMCTHNRASPFVSIWNIIEVLKSKNFQEIAFFWIFGGLLWGGRFGTVLGGLTHIIWVQREGADQDTSKIYNTLAFHLQYIINLHVLYMAFWSNKSGRFKAIILIKQILFCKNNTLIGYIFLLEPLK